MAEQLSDALAREIVSRHLARLDSLRVGHRFASSRRPEDLARSLDALVIGPPLICHAAPAIAQAIRDALLVLSAVAHCPRLSLRSNASFWWELIQKPEQSSPLLLNCFTTRATNRVFPRVVFSDILPQLYPIDSALLAALTNANALVGDEAKSDLAVLEPWCCEMKEPIEWLVHMRFEPNIDSTKLVLGVLSQYAQKVPSVDTSPYRWVGIMLLGKVVDMYTKRGIELVQMKAVQELCTAVPDSIQVEVRFPHSFRGSSYPQRQTIMESRNLEPYLRHAYGFHGSSCTGRMQVLDLANAFQGTNRGFEPNIASVCTMVPFMESLRELRMRVTETTDLVWLAYALFHPRSKMSKWKSLVLSGGSVNERQRFARQPNAGIDWSVLSTVASASNVFSTVLALARRTSIVDSTAMTTSISPSSREIRSASIRKRTYVLTLDNKQLVTLPAGCQVEVCDIKSPDNELIPDATTVMVPGYGFGTVSASNLKNEISIPLAESPETTISVLHLNNLELHPEHRGILLDLFGPTLKHFRVTQSEWFNRTARLDRLTDLHSLDFIHFDPLETPRLLASWANLHSLGLVCRQNEFDACAKMLARLPSGLVLLRLHIVEYNNADPPRTSELNTKIKRRLVDMPSLESAFVAHVPRYQHRSQHASSRSAGATQYRRFDLEAVPVTPGLTRIECAFLSVVRRAQPGDPLMNLDSMVVRIIFSFWSTNLKWSLVCEQPRLAAISADEPRSYGDTWGLGKCFE